MTTTEQVKNAMRITLAVTEAIRQAGEIAEGPLYAMLMNVTDFGGFQKLVQTILNTGLVERKAGNVLRWVGPTFPTAA